MRRKEAMTRQLKIRKATAKEVKPFTLNELLAIAIALMLLASLAAPSLMEAKAVFKKSLCMDNLIVLSKASQLYVDAAGCYAPAASDSLLRWHGQLREDLTKRPDSTKSPLRPFMKGLKALKPCPSFESEASDSRPAPEKGGGGYGYNENIGSLRAVQTEFDLWDPRCKASGILPGDLVTPRETALFTDTATRTDGQGEVDASGSLAESAFCKSYDIYNKGRPMWGTPNPTIHFRHQGSALIAWCDGHISSESPSRSKGEWGKSSLGFVGSRTHSAFLPRRPVKEDTL